MFSFHRMNTYTKLLRIGTQQHSPYIYILPITKRIFTSNNEIKSYVRTKDMYKKKISL